MPPRFSSGFIYLLRLHNSDIYKIGRTTDIARRMSQFSILPPHELVYFRRVAEPAPVESALHERFAHRRVKNEWFRLDVEELLELETELLRVQCADLVVRVTLDFAHETEITSGQIDRFVRVLRRLHARLERRESGVGQFAYYAEMRDRAAQTIRSELVS